MHGAGRLHRQLQVSGAGQCAPRRRHVCADADPQGALSRHAGPRAGGRLGRGVDHPDPGQERATARRSPRSMFNYSGGMGARADQAAARRPPAIRPASPRCRSRSWKPRCRSCSTSKELRAGSGGAGASRGGDGQMIGGACAPTATGCSTPCRAARTGAGGPRRRRARRGRPLPGQRQACERGAQARDAAGRPGDAGDAGRRRLWPGRGDGPARFLLLLYVNKREHGRGPHLTADEIDDILTKIIACSALARVAVTRQAPGPRYPTTSIKYGVLTDLSGPASDAHRTGFGHRGAMAVDDFGGKVSGKPSRSSPPTIRSSRISAADRAAMVPTPSRST